MQCTLTKALSKVKNLEKQIAQFDSNFPCLYVVAGEDTTPAGYNSQKEFEDKAKALMQKREALLRNRRKLKQALIMANAETTIKTDKFGEISIAEAIDIKNWINLERGFIKNLKGQYTEMSRLYAKMEEEVNARLDNLLSQNMGKTSKVKEEEYEAIAKPFLHKNKPKLLNPIDIQKVISQKEELIDFVETELDFLLSEANAKTEIEVDLEDE